MGVGSDWARSQFSAELNPGQLVLNSTVFLLGQRVVHAPELTELVLIDCVSMHQRLFGTLSPVMRLFGFRYALLNPGAFPMQVSVEGIKIEDLRRFTRAEFLKEVLPRLRIKVG